MKITVEKTVEMEVELPNYFRIDNSDSYFMVIDHNTAVMVKDHTYNPDLWLYPSIEVVRFSFVSLLAKKGIIEITEQEFKEVYSNVYLELEKIMN
jgi:hypothetical protein